MSLTGHWAAPISGHAPPRPLQVAMLTQPYPDGFVLTQCLRVLCGAPVSCHSRPDALLRRLQDPLGPRADLVLCDDTVCGMDTSGVCLALSRLGLGERLVLLADAHRARDPLLHSAMAPGMRWLLRPWTVHDLNRLLAGLRPA